ncbi:MAG: DUF2760 domain-containing protein [Methylococcaceae bacterium]
MNKNYAIDLSLMPSTFDLWHVYLIVAVIILALILIFVLLAMIIGMVRRAKKSAIDLANLAAVPVEPEVKFVEKIVEVEKIVQAPAPEPVVLKEASSDAALQLLSILQKDARFIDFIKEDIGSYSDADIGVAARVVHEGCNKAINDYFTLKTVRSEQEGSKVTLAKGFNASEVRLTGNIVGKAPFSGSLVHKGWEVTDVRLPKLTQGHNAKIVAAAEVEL